jgi:2-haloacid dehalogenase
MLKPAPEPYRLVLDSQHADAADAMLIAAHDWDITGAAIAGLRTAFISRDGHVPLPAGPAPSMSAVSLKAIASRLITEQPSP